METKKKCDVIIADSDREFIKVLSILLNEVTGKKNDPELEVKSAYSTAEVLALLAEHTCMLVMHDTLIMNEPTGFSDILTRKHKDCKFVVLLSPTGGDRILELMNAFKNKGSIPDVYLLRDDHSIAVLIMFLEDVLNKPV